MLAEGETADDDAYGEDQEEVVGDSEVLKTKGLDTVKGPFRHSKRKYLYS